MKINKMLATLFFGAALSSTTSVAQNLPIPDLGLGILGPSTLSGIIDIGTIFIENPGNLPGLLNLPLAVTSMVTPAVGILMSGDVQSIPNALINGELLLAPSLVILPDIPLVTAPLPGL
ncbi:hypothetical protein [Spongiibacter marinus]|uniref:hypothetical protein n=1 Tax=Spongiibacter marinus TaxID=354246 RepID=UPI0035BE13D9